MIIDENKLGKLIEDRAIIQKFKIGKGDEGKEWERIGNIGDKNLGRLTENQKSYRTIDLVFRFPIIITKESKTGKELTKTIHTKPVVDVYKFISHSIVENMSTEEIIKSIRYLQNASYDIGFEDGQRSMREQMLEFLDT
jgi:hypothetical protein